MSNLAKRTISAIILAPIFLYVLYIGGLVFFWFSLAMFLIMFYEWFNMTCKSNYKILWILGGFIYLGVSFLAYIYLERYRPYEEFWGLANPPTELISLLLIVWVNDIFCYFFGKNIGGPKLAPSISPNKTWSGSIGGLIGCVALYFVINYVSEKEVEYYNSKSFYLGLGFYILMGAISQIGDLFESWVKRKFGVKDSGNTIPGHGGVLDRMDGLLLILFIYGVFILINSHNVISL